MIRMWVCGVIVKGEFCKVRTKVWEGENTKVAPTGCKDLKQSKRTLQAESSEMGP